MTCAQCGSAAITNDDRPWWRDDLCAACNWRARAEALRELIDKHNIRLVDQCLSDGCNDGPFCNHCPLRYIIELPKEQG